jgi:Cytosine/adenosine deaminases
MLSQGFITKNPSRPAGYFNVRKQVKNLQADYEQEWMNMISNKQADEYYMQQAIEMARKAPDFPFGAVIVRRTTGEIIAKGVNRSYRKFRFFMVRLTRLILVRQLIHRLTGQNLICIQQLSHVLCAKVPLSGLEFLLSTMGLRSLICKALVGGKLASGLKKCLVVPHFDKAQ